MSVPNRAEHPKRKMGNYTDAMSTYCAKCGQPVGLVGPKEYEHLSRFGDGENAPLFKRANVTSHYAQPATDSYGNKLEKPF